MESKEFSFKCPISSVQLEQIAQNPSSLLEHIPGPILIELKEFIVDLLNDKDGGPTVSDIQISNFKMDQHTQKGSFRLSFAIDRRFCCSDIESCNTDYLDFKYAIENMEFMAKGSYFDWTLNN